MYSNHTNSEIIASVIGKTTCNGFSIRVETPIHRNSFLTTEHEEQLYVLGVQKIWREKNILFADLRVIGNVPNIPFKNSSALRISTDEEIEKVLGLENNYEKSINLGKIQNSEINARFHIENLGRIFVTGRTGSGKSYTVGVIIEELIQKQIPTLIFDRHGEYSSLKFIREDNVPTKDKFFQIENPTQAFARFIVEFGDKEINPGVDLNLDYLLGCQPEELISLGQCSIINLRGLDIPIQKNITEIILTRLYEASTKREIPPCFLFIDEAHELAGKKKESVMEKVRLIAQEGRKFGLNLVVITQRPQALDVTLRAQAGTWIIHKLTDINDIQITCKSAEGLSLKDDEEIQVLSSGEAIIAGEITLSAPVFVKIRERITVHGGAGYNILDYIEHGEIYESELIKKLKGKIIPKQLENSKSFKKSSMISSGEIEKQLKEITLKYKREKKRADEAVELAERLLYELKNQKK